VVEVRRNVSIHKGALRRIGAPQGTYIRDARGAGSRRSARWRRCCTAASGKAARPVAATGGQAASSASTTGQAIRADKALPEIAALIDKDQFELISQPESGIVVIQGGAGSGKTTVALHRVAFLNFNDGRRFRPNQHAVRGAVAVAGALRRGVLPALGVSGVPVVTYTSWARTTRMKLLPDSPIKYNEDPPETCRG
jgi:DNA helicase-2/ATP-dependent DNA helicase PcrA